MEDICSHDRRGDPHILHKNKMVSCRDNGARFNTECSDTPPMHLSNCEEGSDNGKRNKENEKPVPGNRVCQKPSIQDRHQSIDLHRQIRRGTEKLGLLSEEGDILGNNEVAPLKNPTTPSNIQQIMIKNNFFKDSTPPFKENKARATIYANLEGNTIKNSSKKAFQLPFQSKQQPISIKVAPGPKSSQKSKAAKAKNALTPSSNTPSNNSGAPNLVKHSAQSSKPDAQGEREGQPGGSKKATCENTRYASNFSSNLEQSAGGEAQNYLTQNNRFMNDKGRNSSCIGNDVPSYQSIVTNQQIGGSAQLKDAPPKNVCRDSKYTAEPAREGKVYDCGNQLFEQLIIYGPEKSELSSVSACLTENATFRYSSLTLCPP